MNLREVGCMLGVPQARVEQLIADGSLNAVMGERNEQMLSRSEVACFLEAQHRRSEQALNELVALSQEMGLYDQD